MTGFKIARANELLSIDQTFYTKKLKELDQNHDYPKFRSIRMHLVWNANTRPGLLFGISQIALITLERFKNGPEAHCKRFNKEIRYAQVNSTSLKFSKLNMNSTRIAGYSDAAFANNHDFKSQLIG